MEGGEEGKKRKKNEGESTSYEAPFHLGILHGLVAAGQLSHGSCMLSGVLRASVSSSADVCTDSLNRKVKILKKRFNAKGADLPCSCRQASFRWFRQF